MAIEMKKYLIIFVIICGLLALGFCEYFKENIKNETEKNDQSKFCGTWSGSLITSRYPATEDYPVEIIYSISELTFRDTEGNVDFTMFLHDVKESFNGTYELNGDILTITNSTSGKFTFTYRFEDENGQMVLFLDGSKFIKI